MGTPILVYNSPKEFKIVLFKKLHLEVFIRKTSFESFYSKNFILKFFIRKGIFIQKATFNSIFIFVKKYGLRLYLVFFCMLTDRAGGKLQGTYPKVYY